MRTAIVIHYGSAQKNSFVIMRKIKATFCAINESMQVLRQEFRTVFTHLSKSSFESFP